MIVTRELIVEALRDYWFIEDTRDLRTALFTTFENFLDTYDSLDNKLKVAAGQVKQLEAELAVLRPPPANYFEPSLRALREDEFK